MDVLHALGRKGLSTSQTVHAASQSGLPTPALYTTIGRELLLVGDSSDGTNRMSYVVRALWGSPVVQPPALHAAGGRALKLFNGSISDAPTSHKVTLAVRSWACCMHVGPLTARRTALLPHLITAMPQHIITLGILLFVVY